MSAFMCSARTISIIADVMNKSIWSSIPAKKIFFNLVDMNIDALKARYKEISVDKNDFEYIETQYSLIEAIKCMDCYLYQCSEGDIFKRYTFQEIVLRRDKLIVDYMHEKIMNSPEYEALPWE